MAPTAEESIAQGAEQYRELLAYVTGAGSRSALFPRVSAASSPSSSATSSARPPSASARTPSCCAK